MTTAIYVRVSTKDQADKGFSLDAQEKIGRDVCARNKWPCEVFVESGRSASKETLDNRPALEKIIDLAENGKIARLFVTELDRLSRNPVTLAYIKKILSENDVKVVTPSQVYDFRDDEDDFITDLLGILAKRENRVRVKRIKRAKAEAVKLGRWVGSTLPYGWTKQPCSGDRLRHNQLVPHPEESKIYLLMVDLSMQGLGMNTIARRLNEMGIPTRCSTGSKSYLWKSGTIFKILKSPLYKGDYSYGPDGATVPGIITPERWTALQAALRGNYNNAKRNTQRVYLLRGLLVCGRCGQRMFGLIKEAKRMRCYCCLSKRPDPDPRWCGMKNIPLDGVDDFVWGAVRRVVSDSGLVRKAIAAARAKAGDSEADIRREIARVDKLITAATAQAGKLIDLYTVGGVDPADVERKAGEIKARRELLHAERASLESKLGGDTARAALRYVEDYLADVRARLDGMTAQERYDLVHTIVRRVVVQYDDVAKEHSVSVEFLLPVDSGTPPPIAPPPHWRRGRSGGQGVSLEIAGRVCSGTPGVKRRDTYI